MADIVNKTQTTKVLGCTVAVSKLDYKSRGEPQYAATVSHPYHNTHGEHIATPTWQNIGSESDTKSFIVSKVIEHAKSKLDE